MENLSVKQLAEELEISKQAIFKWIDKLPPELTVVDTEEGYRLPPETVQYIKDKVTTNRLKKSGKATGNLVGEVAINLPPTQFPTDQTIQFLKRQLSEKDKQIERKDKLIDDLRQDIKDSQKLVLMQQQNQQQLMIDYQKAVQKKWWQFWK